MDEFWAKRELFRDWVEDAKRKLGATNVAVVATEVMGLAPTSLRKYLSKSATHKPSDLALRRLFFVVAGAIACIGAFVAHEAHWADEALKFCAMVFWGPAALVLGWVLSPWRRAAEERAAAHLVATRNPPRNSRPSNPIDAKPCKRGAFAFLKILVPPCLTSVDAMSTLMTWHHATDSPRGAEHCLTAAQKPVRRGNQKRSRNRRPTD